MGELGLPRFKGAQSKIRLGVHSPSGFDGHFPRRLARAIESVRRLSGNDPVVSTNATRVSPLKDEATIRAQDLHNLLLDPNVDVIMSMTGGYLATDTIRRLDFDLIGAHPKPIVGFSDATALLLAIHARAGLTTYHGPSLLASMGELRFADASWSGLLSALSGEPLTFRGEDVVEISDEFRFWDKDDDDPAPSTPSSSLIGLVDGCAEGSIFGGNLETLLIAIAAGFCPPLDGCILFWEAAFGNFGKLTRDLATLAAGGVLERISGMIVAAPFNVSGTDAARVYRLAEDLARQYRLPTVAGLRSGHGQPISTVPIGRRARIDGSRTQPSLVIYSPNPTTESLYA
jgi:muramoyltetrapeptide carboxypeptidase